MLKVGLTGGFACGKSTVADMFAALGVHIAKADEIAHRLMRPGAPVYAAVVEHFGRSILDSAGTIDRQQLAAMVFDPDSPRIQELNDLVHPAVVAEQDRWCAELKRCDPDGIAMIEAALILEAGVRSHFDRLIVVSCDANHRAKRLAMRMGIDEKAAQHELERRSRAQWPDQQKAEAADFLIDNSGSLAATEQQVERVHGALRQSPGL
ncbi:MAG: dephospho-CoA kinase [Terriglobales bacterium]|jgi:dephospho-CoA kinase